MKTAVKWFSRNHVAGNFLMLAILLAGFAAWFQMRKEIFPELEVDAVLVTIPYPNATPVEAERGVNVPSDAGDTRNWILTFWPSPRQPHAMGRQRGGHSAASLQLVYDPAGRQ